MSSFDESFEVDADGVSVLLSAYLDDEISTDERTRVESALIDDPDLRLELEGLAHARSLVRELPLLELPEHLAHNLTSRTPLGPLTGPRRRTRTRAVALSALASVAFWGMVATSGGATAVVPDLAGVVGAHALAVAKPNIAEADPSIMFTAPGSVESFELVYAGRRGELAHAMYTDGATEISVFEQPGRIDWGRVPVAGERVEMADAQAWTGRVDGQEVMLIERGGMVYTLVASARSELAEMSAVMPGDDENWFDQLRRASYRTVTFFGLSG